MDILYKDTLIVGHTIAEGSIAAHTLATSHSEIVFSIIDGLRRELSPFGMWEQTIASVQGVYIVERLDATGLLPDGNGLLSYKYAVATCVDPSWPLEGMSVSINSNETHAYDEVNLAFTWNKENVRYCVYRINISDPSDFDYPTFDGIAILTPPAANLIVDTYNDSTYETA